MFMLVVGQGLLELELTPLGTATLGSPVVLCRPHRVINLTYFSDLFPKMRLCQVPLSFLLA